MGGANRRGALGRLLLLAACAAPLAACGVKGAPRPVLPQGEPAAPAPEEGTAPGAGARQGGLPAMETGAERERTLTPAPPEAPCPADGSQDGGECP
jgi:predicted small lipoprotein YifL